MELAIMKTAASVPEKALDLSAAREIYTEILAAQEEVGGTVTYRAKIPSGGGKVFEILTGDEDTDTAVQTIAGVVIHEQKCSAHFAQDDQNSPPLCASVDWAYGTDRESGEVRRCADCPFHEFGSAAKGGGKACKDMIQLYIMTEESPIPLKLTLPPTSLKNWQSYRLATLAPKRLRPLDVVTEFSLVTATNAAGIKYSVVKPRLLGRLSEEARAQAQFFAAGMKSAVSGETITAEDYERTEKGAPNEE